MAQPEVTTLANEDFVNTNDTSILAQTESEDLNVPQNGSVPDSSTGPEFSEPYSEFNDTEITDEDMNALKSGQYDSYYEEQAKPVVDMSTYEENATTEADVASLDNETNYETSVRYLKSIGQGVWDAGENILESVGTLVDGAIGLGYDMEDPNYFLNLAKGVQMQSPELEADWTKAANSSFGTQMTKTFSQFLIPFGALMKGVKVMQSSGKVMPWMKKMVGAAGVGAATDFAVWDYTDKRLADFMHSFGSKTLDEANAEFMANPDDPATFTKLKKVFGETLTGTWMTALKYDEDDSPLMARTKQGLEGLLFGKIIDPIFNLLGVYGRSKVVQKYGQRKTTVETPVPVKDKVTKEPLEPGATLIGDIPNVELTPKLQKQFTEIYYTGNKEQASELLARALKPHLNDVKGVEYISKFSDIVDELMMNAKETARTSRKVAQQKAVNEGFDATADLGADFVDQKGAEVLENYNALTRELDTVEFKAGVVDRAMLLQLKDAVRKYKASINPATKVGDPVLKAKVNDALHYSAFISEMVRNPRSNVGAALQKIQNSKYMIDAEGNKALAPTATNTLKKVKEYNGLDDVINMIDDIDVSNGIPLGMTDAIKERTLKDFLDAGGELFRNSVLGTPSLALNVSSNAIMMLSRTADLHAAAFRGGVDEAGKKAVTHKMALAHDLGYLMSIYDGIKIMARSFWKDKALFSQNKNFVNEYAPKVALSSKNIGVRNPGLIGKGVNKSIDAIGTVTRSLPGATRSMMASDEMFKLMNHRAYLYSQVMGELQDQINPLLHPIKFQQAFKKRMSEVLNTNKVKAKQSYQEHQNFKLWQDGLEEAHLATLTSRWGSKGEGFYKWLRSSSLATFILPFVRAPINAALYVGRTTPGLNLTPIGKRISQDIAEGGFKAERALGHMSMASALWTYAAMTAFTKGDELQGSSALDSKEYRELGIERTTYQNERGEFVNYRQAEPQSPRWSLMANLLHQWMSLINKAGDQLTDSQIEDAMQRLAVDSALFVLADFKDKSSFQGVERMLAFFDEGSPLRAENYLYGFIAGWTSILSSNVKYLRQKMGDKAVGIKYDPDTLWEHMQVRYGGGEVPYLNLFGNEVPASLPQEVGDLLDSENTFLNAIPTPIKATSNLFKTPEEMEVLKVKQALPNETVLGTVPKTIRNIKIDNRERHNLLKFVKYAPIDGLNLNEELKALFTKRIYKEGDAKRKAYLINKVYRNRMDVAKALMIIDGAAAIQGLPRPHAQGMGLVEYGRDKALLTESLRIEANEKNRIVGKDHKFYMDLNNLEAQADAEQAKIYRKAQKIYNQLINPRK